MSDALQHPLGLAEPRGFWRTFARADLHLAFGLVAGLIYVLGLWRRLWWPPELVRAALWLALPLAAWNALRMLVAVQKATFGLALSFLLIAYPAMFAAQLALAASTLPVLGAREAFVIEQARWDRHGSTRPQKICSTSMTGSAPGLMAGSPVSFCADAFPRPIFAIPPVRLTVTHAPHAAWLHHAWPAVDNRECHRYPHLCHTPR